MSFLCALRTNPLHSNISSTAFHECAPVLSFFYLVLTFFIPHFLLRIIFPTHTALPATIGSKVLTFFSSMVPAAFSLQGTDTPFSSPIVKIILEHDPTSCTLKTVFLIANYIYLAAKYCLPISAIENIPNFIFLVSAKSSKSGSSLEIKDVCLLFVGYSSIFGAIFLLYQFSLFVQKFAGPSRYVQNIFDVIFFSFRYHAYFQCRFSALFARHLSIFREVSVIPFVFVEFLTQ